MKKLKIGKEIENPKSIFQFELSFVHGDADGYSSEIIEISESHPKLLEFANFLNSISKKGRETAEQKHAEFFQNIEDEDYEGLHFDYPYDNTSDYSYPASCQGLDIFYYDANGKKFKVTLE